MEINKEDAEQLFKAAKKFASFFEVIPAGWNVSKVDALVELEAILVEIEESQE